MKKTDIIILVLVIAVSTAAAVLFWRLPARNCRFDAERAVADIEVISADHHSVLHPEARAEVRSYLLERLAGMGADTLVKHYSDVEWKGFIYDVDDIVAEFPPLEPSEDTTWLMMVAHYDSRYPWAPVRDTVCSYGAADDGYGVSVILETARCALEKRSEWKQGLRIVFTDSEEAGMDGMDSLFCNSKELFNDVGLVINIEARGPYGPVLLFETSKGNDRLLQLYRRNAIRKCTYSLTNVVYGFMPNFTDFTIVKDSLPGLNFSTIADVNHYHTDLDNFENISPAALRQYGAQVLPVVEEYLCNEAYSDRDALRGEHDRVFLTTPVLGMVNLPKGGWLALSIVIFLLAAVLIFLDRNEIVKILKSSLNWLLCGLLACGAGTLLCYLGCLLSGARFKPFGIVVGMFFDNGLMLAAAIVLALAILVFFLRTRRPLESLIGVVLLLTLLSIVSLAAVGENMLFLVPLAAAVLGILLRELCGLRIFLLAGIVLAVLHGVSFLYALSMALTVGALGAVLLLATFDLAVVAGLVRLYLERGK